MSIVQKCMAIMSIIITEEDLCKKHAKKCAKICQFSSLPSKWIQAVNDPNTKIDSKPHICAYNYNTRTGFRAHKKTWGPRVLSSTLFFILFRKFCPHTATTIPPYNMQPGHRWSITPALATSH